MYKEVGMTRHTLGDLGVKIKVDTAELRKLNRELCGWDHFERADAVKLIIALIERGRL
jgi:hypothetical protein